MDTLRPVDISDFYVKRVAAGMSKYFWNNIFKQVFDILNDHSIDNSKDDLIKALKSGRIWYEKGAFRTDKRFSNAIAKTLEEFGASYRRNGYYIDRTKLPIDVVKIIDSVKTAALVKTTKIEQYIAGLLPVLDKLTVDAFIQTAVQQMFKSLEVDIMKSAQEKKIPIIELDLAMPKVDVSKQKQRELRDYWQQRDAGADKIRQQIAKAPTPQSKQQLRDKLVRYQRQTYENAPQIDVQIDHLKLDKTSENIAKDYVYNMNYWVKRWEAKDIIKMRQDVADMVQKGVRIPEVAKYFEKRWNVAKDKALFLATNESHLAASVVKATMYQKLGCTHFRWIRSVSREKRQLHLDLAKPTNNQYGVDGTNVFAFDNPPIIDEKLGIRGLPRQIWNCKCMMAPVPPSLADQISKREQVQNAKTNVFSYIQQSIRNSKQRRDNNWKYRRFG